MCLEDGVCICLFAEKYMIVIEEGRLTSVIAEGRVRVRERAQEYFIVIRYH